MIKRQSPFLKLYGQHVKGKKINSRVYLLAIMFGGCGNYHSSRYRAMPKAIESIDTTTPRRSLSITANRPIAQKSAPCYLLDRLPPEIRLLIYREVVRSWAWPSGLHILERMGSIGPSQFRYGLSYTGCVFHGEEEVAIGQRMFVAQHLKCQERKWNQTSTHGRPLPESNEKHLSLFLSCRTM